MTSKADVYTFRVISCHQPIVWFLTMADRLLPAESRTAAITKLGQYKNRVGLFAWTVVAECSATMPAYQWWQQFGGGCPELQTLDV
jgi:hypothetical protein